MYLTGLSHSTSDKELILKNSEANFASVVVILDLGSEVVFHFPHVPDVVLDDQRHVWRHGERYLVGQARGFGEHVQIPAGALIRFFQGGGKLLAGEGQRHRFLHLDNHRLLLLVHIGTLRQLDVACPDVTRGGELDPILRAADVYRVPELRQIPGMYKSRIEKGSLSRSLPHNPLELS